MQMCLQSQGPSSSGTATTGAPHLPVKQADSPPFSRCHEGHSAMAFIGPTTVPLDSLVANGGLGCDMGIVTRESLLSAGHPGKDPKCKLKSEVQVPAAAVAAALQASGPTCPRVACMTDRQEGARHSPLEQGSDDAMGKGAQQHCPHSCPCRHHLGTLRRSLLENVQV